MVFKLNREAGYLHHGVVALLGQRLLLRSDALLNVGRERTAMSVLCLKGDDAAVQVFHLCLAQKHVRVDLLQAASYLAPVLAVGKGTDKIELVEVSKDADLRYYRKDGVHYVPKISLKDLIL